MKKSEIIDYLSEIFNKARDMRGEITEDNFEELYMMISFLYQQANL